MQFQQEENEETRAERVSEWGKWAEGPPLRRCRENGRGGAEPHCRPSQRGPGRQTQALDCCQQLVPLWREQRLLYKDKFYWFGDRVFHSLWRKQFANWENAHCISNHLKLKEGKDKGRKEMGECAHRCSAGFIWNRIPQSGQRFHDLFWPSSEKKRKTTETSTDARIILENMLSFLY